MECGISKMSVSLALRKKHGVSEKTRRRVEEKAKELGYHPDPELAALHRYRHNAKEKNIQATLAWFNTGPQSHPFRQNKEFDLYWEGAYANARQRGYRLEAFNLEKISAQRLKTILTTRNIRGILLPPQHDDRTAQLEHFDWSSFAIVRFGQTLSTPKTHYVASAHMMNTIMAFEQALQLGYKRIGYIGDFNYTKHFTAGYLWAQNKRPKEQRLPLLKITPPYHTKDKQHRLKSWLNQTRPDAILTDKKALPLALKNLGYRIPEDIGLVTTSIHDTPIDAGINQRPYDIGHAAIRLLTALISEKAFGIPEYCDEMLIEGRWVDGSMLPKRDAR